MKVLTPEQIAKEFSIAYPLEKVRITQAFGKNFNNFYKQLGMKGHNGLDIRAKTGTQALACFDGRISAAGADMDGGVLVKIESKKFTVEGQEIMLEAIYYHLLRPMVQAGDKVVAGQLIALCDNTGRYTTGAHLHFGIKVIYKKGNKWEKDWSNGYYGAIDPEPLFDKDPYVLPVDERYGKRFNWLLEFMNRFKRPSVHKELIKLGRHPSSLSDRELKALVYGNWLPKHVFDPAMWSTWTERER